MSKRKDKNRVHGRKDRGRQPATRGRGHPLVWFGVACACYGSAWLSKTLFEAPAGDFYRAINRAPWASLNSHAALGIALTVVIGAQALSMVVLGTYSVTRLVSGTPSRA